MIMYRRAISKNPSQKLEKRKGRPTDNGITASDGVSSFIEIHRRIFITQGFNRNALQKAKDLVIVSFVDVMDLENPERAIDRDWAIGKKQAQALSSECLKKILEPHKIK